MKYSIATSALVAAAVSGVTAQVCAPGSAVEIGGNWYCDAVKAISYIDFGSTGTYNKITSMEGGNCQSEPFDYSGALAPLDGEVSWHFRGPLTLKQFAFYAPGSDSTKRDIRPSPHERRQHGHAHFHKRHNQVREVQERHVMEEKRAVGDMITATIDGQVVSWANEYDGGAQATGAPAAPANAAGQPGTNNAAPPAAAPTMNAGNGYWGRQAYYDADGQIAIGLTFLNNMGGQGSGVFDYVLGNSLSYASADAKSGSASPQILADQTLGDGDEVIIMTDKPCQNGDCGATRPGGVAYHGFDGAKKVFLLEFDMPVTGTTGFNKDMPAVWILNAQIPLTIQYGRPECSCWESGCGEWDIFEVLDAGNMRCKSTVHGNISGGDSNYFDRPADSTVKVAVIFDGDNQAGHIIVLDDATSFEETLSDAQVAAFVNSEGIDGAAWSLFRLGA